MGKKSKEKRNIFLDIISVILILIIIFCVVKLIPEVKEIYNQHELKNEYVAAVETPDPSNEKVAVLNPNWEELKQMNPDIVGWIYVPNTPINYPIVQGSDNDYYLYRASDGTPNQYGSIFLDANASSDFSDQHSIIYGHNVLGNSGMFTKLTKFLDPAFLQANPNFYILTPNGNYQAQILSATKVIDATNSYNTNFNNEQEVVDLVESDRASANASSSVEFNPGDKYVSLSTCDLSYGLHSQHRVLINAKLVSYNEPILIQK